MNDLIRREEVIEALKLLTDEDDPYDEGYNLGLNTAILEVKKYIPTAEPKVGNWIEKDGMWCDDPTFRCSVCGEEIELIEGTPKSHGMNYCPNCGARMERRTDE